MDLSIIIVNWNSTAYAADCVRSIQHACAGLQYEIIVVDNASSDESVTQLSHIDGLRLIVSSTNLGFARANNLGYRESTGNVLLFLNPDTVVEKGAIERMHQALVSSSDFGIVGCKLLNSDRSLQTSCVQSFPTLLNQLTDIESLKLRFPKVRMWGIAALFSGQTGIVPVEVVSGACLMIRREVFEKVGGFSTDYFMYCEDVDLCYKVARQSLQVGYVADATVIHHGGQSSKQVNESLFGDVVNHDATRTFLAKTRGKLHAVLYCWTICVSACLRLAMLRLLPPTWLGKNCNSVSAARRKWAKLLRWSLGRERWVSHLVHNDDSATQITPVGMR